MTDGAAPAFLIRIAGPDDAAAAARVQREGWRSAYAAIFPPESLETIDTAAQERKWAGRLDGAGGRFAFVASVNSEVVGVIAGGPPRIAASERQGEIYSLYVLSAHRERGIGEALMSAAFHHLHHTGRSGVMLWTLAGNMTGRAWFRRLGGREEGQADRPSIGDLVRPSIAYGWDNAGAAAAGWPMRRVAVELRPADFDDAAGIARVQVDTWRAVYRKIMPPKLLDEMSDVRIAAFWATIIADNQGLSFCLVACAGETVVGFASCGPRQHASLPQQGEVYALYVRPEMHGRGIGRRLVEAAFDRMLELGITEGRIWTLRENAPARAFYARIGGTRTEDGHNDIGGIRYPEVAYDWPDLRRWKETR